MSHEHNVDNWFLGLFLLGYANCSLTLDLLVISHLSVTGKYAALFLKSVPTINQKVSKYPEQNLPLYNFLNQLTQRASEDQWLNNKYFLPNVTYETLGQQSWWWLLWQTGKYILCTLKTQTLIINGILFCNCNKRELTETNKQNSIYLSLG